MFLLVVPLLMITFKANNIESKYIPLEKYSLFKRFYLIFYCLCFYVTNSIVPNNLHYHYFYPIKPDEALPFLYYVYPFLFVLVCFFLLKRIFASKFKWFYLLCIALMAIELSIELQVIPMTRPAIVADRYMYFPLFPLILMALVYISNSGYRKRTVFKRLMVPFAVIYLIFFVTYSNQLVLNWYAQNLLLQ
jgi:hypothetical protein